MHHGPGGDRLLAEVNIDAGDNHFVSSGVRKVQDGLSFPTRDAPRRYHQALETACTRGRGVFQFGPDMEQEQLMPWSLKGSLVDRGSSLTVRCGDTMTCKVANSFEFLNETHMLIHPSLIRGAASGLMVRPTPPGQQDATIPRGKYLCFFAPGTPTPEGPPSDYELGSTQRDVVYNGRDIGRYINHGGLLEGIRVLVASCNREDGCDMYQPHVAEKLFDDHSNVVYTRVGRDMVVTAKDAITTSPNKATELLANYGLPYWHYTLTHTRTRTHTRTHTHRK